MKFSTSLSNRLQVLVAFLTLVGIGSFIRIGLSRTGLEGTWILDLERTGGYDQTGKFVTAIKNGDVKLASKMSLTLHPDKRVVLVIPGSSEPITLSGIWKLVDGGRLELSSATWGGVPDIRETDSHPLVVTVERGQSFSETRLVYDFNGLVDAPKEKRPLYVFKRSLTPTQQPLVP